MNTCREFCFKCIATHFWQVIEFFQNYYHQGVAAKSPCSFIPHGQVLANELLVSYCTIARDSYIAASYVERFAYTLTSSKQRL